MSCTKSSIIKHTSSKAHQFAVVFFIMNECVFICNVLNTMSCISEMFHMKFKVGSVQKFIANEMNKCQIIGGMYNCNLKKKKKGKNNNNNKRTHGITSLVSKGKLIASEKKPREGPTLLFLITLRLCVMYECGGSLWHCHWGWRSTCWAGSRHLGMPADRTCR